MASSTDGAGPSGLVLTLKSSTSPSAKPKAATSSAATEPCTTGSNASTSERTSCTDSATSRQTQEPDQRRREPQRARHQAAGSHDRVGIRPCGGRVEHILAALFEATAERARGARHALAGIGAGGAAGVLPPG